MANTDDILRKVLYTPARLWLRRKPVELPLDASKIKKILVLRTDAIGDMIVTTPVFTILKEQLNARIDVVASPRNAKLLADDPRIHHTLVYDGTLKSMFAIRRATRREHYDLVIALVLHRTTRGGLLANLWAGRHAITATFSHNSRTQSYETWFSAQLKVPRDTSTMADMQIQMLNQLFGWDIRSADVPLRIHFPAQDPKQDPKQELGAPSNANPKAPSTAIREAPSTAIREAPEVAGQLLGKPLTILNLSAGHATTWSFDRNREFLERLHTALPTATVRIMAHGEQVSDAHALAAAFPEFVSVLPQYDDVRLAIASMKGADVLVTPDTSIVHGAAALGIPVVGMYSRRTASPKEWTPHIVPYRAVMTDGPDDVETIEPSRVVDALLDLLQTTSQSQVRAS